VVDGPTSKLVFRQSPSGLFYFDTRKFQQKNTSNVALLNTVRENIEGLSKREVSQAKLAERFMGLARLPSEEDFKKIINSDC
jgi:hypothetical protein